MYIKLRTIQEGARSWQVRAWVEDFPNRLAAVRAAVLDCSCPTHTPARPCRHARQAETQFRRWQTAEIRRLAQQAAGGRPAEALAAAISAALGAPLEACQVFPLPGGRYAVQLPTPAEVRRRSDCGWGTAGRTVIEIAEWPQVGMLEALRGEPDFPLGSFESERTALFPPRLPPLPPPVQLASRPDRQEEHRTGLIDLFAPATRPSAAQPARQTHPARLLAAAAGLELMGDPEGSGRYLPGYRVEDSPACAVAFDLAAQRVRLVPEPTAERLSEGVPRSLQRTIAHTHLPWPEGTGEHPACRVVVRTLGGGPLQPGDPLLVLTANLWEEEGPWAAEVDALLAHTAGLMLRLGHRPVCLLTHGGTAVPLGELAERAAVSVEAGAYRTDRNGWAALGERVLPAVLAGGPVAPADIAILGPDWAGLVELEVLE